MKPVLLSAILAALPQASFAGPALTIYNNDFAVVRETLPLDLQPGVNAVAFSGVTTRVEADSVLLRDRSGQVALRVLEQSYRAEAASESLLLSLHEGRTLDFLVRDRDAREHIVQGRVVRSGHAAQGEAATPIIEVDGRLRFSLPGQPVFPSLGDDAILQPTLAWQLHADKAARIDAELGYITGGLRWEAAYNLVAPETGDKVDLVGWVTVINESGKRFDEASIKLMAGEVNRVRPDMQLFTRSKSMMPMAAMIDEAPAGVTEKSFDEFHLYSLPRPVTLRDRETKQVEFLRGMGVHAPQLYIYDVNKYGSKVATVREFKNSAENGGLGLPLPRGRARFYRQDNADGRMEFVGEDSLDHTARNETVRLRTGDVFDIAVERRQSDAAMSSRNDFREESFEIKLRNRKTTPVEVRITEHLQAGPNWKLVEQSDPHEKLDASRVEFRVILQPDVERVVTYRVRYEWR